MQKRGRRKAGFTLVEIIVVLVILAILAAIMIPSMTGWIDKANKKKAYVELHTVALAAHSAYAEIYATEHVQKLDQFTYGNVGGKDTDTDGFGAATKAFINDPAISDNITGLSMSGEFLYIVYQRDGVQYTYHEGGGHVSITETDAP